jgi:PLD-like domain
MPLPFSGARPGKEVANLLGARAEHLRCVPRCNDRTIECGAREHEHPSRLGFQRIEVIAPQIGRMDAVSGSACEPARRCLSQGVVVASGNELLLEQPHANRGEAHAEVPLQMHDQGRIGHVAERLEFADHPSQLVTRHEELSRECIREPRITERTAAKIELMSQLASGPGRLLRSRCPGCGERTAACTRQRRAHLLRQFDIIRQALLEEPQGRLRAVSQTVRSGTEQDPADVDAPGDNPLARDERLQRRSVKAGQRRGHTERDLAAIRFVVAEGNPVDTYGVGGRFLRQADSLPAAAQRLTDRVQRSSYCYINPAYTALRTPFPDLPATRLCWPASKRPHGAALHAKIIVVDDRTALITSANLTSRAMEANLECGILIRGGSQPRAIRDHITGLQAHGHLRP